MPGQYNSDQRTITLETEFQVEPELTVATLINLVVADLLAQQGFPFALLPEAVDIAVLAVGLGLPQSLVSLVNDRGSFWDPTAWEIGAKPFLDAAAIAYVSALTAWTREPVAPDWFAELPTSVATATQKSFKYLLKTNDCFCQQPPKPQAIGIDTAIELVTPNNGRSSHIIGLKFFAAHDAWQTKLETAVEHALRSGQRELVLHAINAATELRPTTGPVIDELKRLTEINDDLIRSKSIIAIRQLGLLDAETLTVAAKMLESTTDYVVFCGLSALSPLKNLNASALRSADRGFVRAMQVCNYSFVGLFATAYSNWLDDPAAHFSQLLATDSPEYLQMALNALEEADNGLVPLN